MELTDGQVALAAAEAGAALVRTRYRTSVERDRKIGSDFATDADLEAETAIRQVLTHHRPDDAQLGGDPIAPAEGLQTNNPGWPGFSSGGWTVAGTLYLSVAL